MKYISEYRDANLVEHIVNQIKSISKKKIILMEVCGGHTMSIHKYGIPNLLPENISLVSGPGCPVCVTGREFIDKAVFLAKLENVIITTYGDLIKVPGSHSSLDKERGQGADIRIVYSTLDALDIARKNPSKKIVFLGIGFETTTPASAVAIEMAFNEKLNNFFLLSSHKVMPPAMTALIDEGVKINGYICPGHVSTITGSEIYNIVPEKYKLGCVITGFEPTDILQAILMLVKQIENNDTKVEIQYSRVVKGEGNLKAQELVTEIFEPSDDSWRGLGLLPKSGLSLRPKYANFDAEKHFDIHISNPIEPKGCICGLILKGLKKPANCALFGTICTPENPVGACMVSSEGSCAAHYKYDQ